MDLLLKIFVFGTVIGGTFGLLLYLFILAVVDATEDDD